VRRIYGEFLDGFSLQEIADGLMRDGILSPSGKDRWYSSTIKSILQNEKYKGDCHLQKTYLPDFLSARRVKNEGQTESYYVENDHAAIISQETFQLAQQHMQERNSLRGATITGHSKYLGKYTFSDMVFCGECGESYRRHQQYSKNNKYYIWVCKRHENSGKNNCSAKPIKECALKKAFLKALNGLLENRENILERLYLTAMSQMSDSCERDIVEIDKEIQRRQTDIVNLLLAKNGGELSEDEYAEQLRKLQIQIDELNLKKGETLTEQSNVQLIEHRTAAVKELLHTGKILDEFDSVIFKTLVRRIIVLNKKEIELEFECGIKVKQKLD